MAALGFIAILAFGALQIYAGYLGTALVVAFFFRFALPITIGSFFGALNVWGWHWLASAAFASPGLLLLIPGTIAGIIAMAKAR
jgi:hypothetical protein